MQKLQFVQSGIKPDANHFNGLELKAYAKNDKGRTAVAQQILRSYEKNFGARPSHLMPILVSAGWPDKNSQLSFGLCNARKHRLFL